MSQNPHELAGAGQPTPEETPDKDTARVIEVLRFDKDYLDFRGTEVEDEPVVPKGSSVQASADESKSVTGLEDLSGDEPESTAQTSAEKDSTKTKPSEPKSGQQTSSKGTSPGKNEPPASK